MLCFSPWLDKHREEVPLRGLIGFPDDCEWETFADFGPPSDASGDAPARRRVIHTLKAFPPWPLNWKQSPTLHFTFNIIKVWSTLSPLLQSGLVGPVTLASGTRVT